MPPRIPRACRKHGCRHTTTDRSGYCTEHQNTGWEVHQQGKSRHQRGYGNDWTIRRARILKRDNHICKECLRGGRAAPATTVDHIVPKAHGGTDDDLNLESLCWPCHRSKTAMERMR
ncbi:HNH endonuclease [Serratia fonticola]|uniref:HNH endonuclease n=1 Tax=Serratia fonticola TaxID=47917 RepID=UPI00094015C6|nr:HNH endonuclease signature motif containing protein [Serratia fonticola]OKP30961.1 HNH endonuclease [Serratia fonticola]